MMERKLKPMSEEQAFSQLAARCAAAEYCPDDMRRKMAAWLLPEGAEERILQRLVDNRFIDENRYAEAFARDKFRYNRWGAQRIRIELQRRHIAPGIIETALGTIDETDADDTLCRLLAQKRRTTRGHSAYEVKMKLLRFALGRGFSMEQARRCLDRLGLDDGPDTPSASDEEWG